MRAIGIDISKHQKEVKYLPGVLDFVMFRSSYGTYKDIRFDQHYDALEHVPVKLAYQYFRSDKIADPGYWRAQADAHLEYCKDKYIDIHVLDIEKTGNSPSMRWGEWARFWLDYVQANTGDHVAYYTNPDVYQAWLWQYGQRWMKDYNFMVAQYPFNKKWDPQLEYCITGDWQPRLPAGQFDWLFWQFSADGNRKGPEYGVVRQPEHVLYPPSVDIQVFNGTVEELTELVFGPEDVEEPIEEPVLSSQIIEVLEDASIQAESLSDKLIHVLEVLGE